MPNLQNQKLDLLTILKVSPNGNNTHFETKTFKPIKITTDVINAYITNREILGIH